MNHAKEPWKVDSPIGAAHPEIRDADGRRIAVIAGTYPMGPKQEDANAARIVACVIACAGIPTSWLKGGAADILEHSQNLLAENTRLKADAERLAAWLKKTTFWIEAFDCQCDAETGHVCDRCVIVRDSLAALAAHEAFKRPAISAAQSCTKAQ